MKQRGFAELFFLSHDSYWDFRHDRAQDSAIDFAESEIGSTNADVARLRHELVALRGALREQQLAFSVLVDLMVSQGLVAEDVLRSAIESATAARGDQKSDGADEPAPDPGPIGACGSCLNAVPMRELVESDDGAICRRCFEVKLMTG